MAGNENSGRRTDAEIIRHYLDLELANKIANKELKRIDEKESATLDEMKIIVVPLVKEGVVKKSETTLITPKPILDITNVLPDNSDKKDNSVEEKD